MHREAKRIAKLEKAYNEYAEFIHGKTSYDKDDITRLINLGIALNHQLIKLANKCDDAELVIKHGWREILLKLEVYDNAPEVREMLEGSIDYTYSLILRQDKEIVDETMPPRMRKYLSDNAALLNGNAV